MPVHKLKNGKWVVDGMNTEFPTKKHALSIEKSSTYQEESSEDRENRLKQQAKDQEKAKKEAEKLAEAEAKEQEKADKEAKKNNKITDSIIDTINDILEKQAK